MTTLVTRLYATREKADAAIAALKAEGFPKKLYAVIGPDKGSDAAALTAAIKAAGVFAKPAATYAAEVAAGKALVVVQAPTGGYFVVRDLLDETGPLPSPVERPDTHMRAVESRGADFLPPGVQRKHWADFFPLLWRRESMPRELYLSDSGWGTLFPNRDRPRATYLTDSAWGTIVPNKDRPRATYLSDSAWGTIVPNKDRPRSLYLSDDAWGGIIPSKDRPRWKYLSDVRWGGPVPLLKQKQL